MKDDNLLKEVNDVLEHVSSAVNAERSSFFLINNNQETLDSYVAQGVNNLIISLPMARGIVGHVVSTGDSVIENNVENSVVFDGSIDSQLNFKTRSILCVPVFNELGATVGAIECLNSQKGKFDRNDLNVLLAFSATFGLILRNAKLHQVANQINGNYVTLLDVFGAVSSEVDLDRLIPLTMEKAAFITNAERSSLFFLDEETGELWTKFGMGLDSTVIRTSKGIVSYVANSKVSYIVNDPYENPYFDSSVDIETGYRTKSVLSVPIFSTSKKVLGVIQVINKIDGEFNTNDLSILEGFASQIRIALENAHLFRQVNGIKNYLDILIQNLDNGIVTVGINGEIQTLNNTFYRIFDIAQKEIYVGQNVNELNGKLKELMQFGNEILIDGKKHYEYGVTFLTDKNKKVITNISVLPMRDFQGEIIGTINVFHDATKENRIRSNLSHYIPQHLVREIINRDDISILKGEKRKCTILFSDIRNFTKLTEELGAVQIISLLNKYFDGMVGSIHKFNGILDKFIGDAIMAVFGIPYTDVSDAINAVDCALEMLTIIDEANYLSENEVKIGIGISTGTVVSGNIGSEKRFEYTVIGDSVNLASRLENATKKYGVNILICENTYRIVKSEFICEEVDVVLLKGMQNPVRIYTVVGRLAEQL